MGVAEQIELTALEEEVAALRRRLAARAFDILAALPNVLDADVPVVSAETLAQLRAIMPETVASSHASRMPSVDIAAVTAAYNESL